MAAGSGQDEQLQPSRTGDSADAPLVSDAESGQPQGEPRPFRLARARAALGALLACAVLAAVLVGPRTAARELVEWARGGGTLSLSASNEEIIEMLDAVNLERMKEGRGSLCYNEKLNEAAQAHSDDMRRGRFFSHTGSDGSRPSQRVTNVGYNWRIVSENIAQGQRNVADVMKAWMKSSGHKANILRDGISHFGFGKKDDYWTQVFASPHGAEGCMETGGGGDGHGGECRDFVPAGKDHWHDSGGHHYHCDWYAKSSSRCETYGRSYEKYGHSASTACCACGGGGGGCMDLVPRGFQEWYDSDGAHYHCDWYGEDKNCERYGDHFANGGYTANQACCVCGGGATPDDSGSGPAPSPPPPPAPPSSGKGCGQSCESHDDCRTSLFC